MKLTRRETLALAGAASAASFAGLPGAAFAAEGEMHDLLKLMAPMPVPDKVLGNPDAKVTMIEYAMPTCPHCARFSNDVRVPFEDKYVKTGLVKFILRPFIRSTLDVAVFMLAEAAAKAVQAQEAPPAADATASSSEAPVSSDPAASSSSAEAQSSSEPPAATEPVVYSEAAAQAYHNVVATFYKTQGTWAVSDKPMDALFAVAVQLGFTQEAFNKAFDDAALFEGLKKMTQQAVDEFKLEGTPTFYINGKQLTGEKSIEQLSAEIDPLLG